MACRIKITSSKCLTTQNKLISNYKETKSNAEKARKTIHERPRKSYKREPETIIEIVDSPAPNRMNRSSFDKEKIFREHSSPSLLHSRRKLSPVKETERDDYIDTADIILNQEINVINKLIERKEAIFSNQYWP